MIVEFTVPWTVEPKQGTKHRVAYAGGKVYARAYTTHEVRKNADAIMLLMAQHRPAVPFAFGVGIIAVFTVTYPWRASESKKVRARGWAPKVTKPDWDNLGKQLSDCAERCGYFPNDAQIYDGRCVKIYGDQPGITVRFADVDDVLTEAVKR